MTPWLKIGLLAAYTAIVAAMSWHAHSVSDRAQQADDLAAEIAAHQQDQQAANAHATSLEQMLAAERQKQAALTNQTETAYAKVTDNCVVPANLVELRNQALTSRLRHPAR